MARLGQPKALAKMLKKYLFVFSDFSDVDQILLKTLIKEDPDRLIEYLEDNLHLVA